MIIILLMLTKMATIGLLKVKLFWKQGYEVIINVHDVTNRILSRESNFIVNVVMEPKLMREVIINSTL